MEPARPCIWMTAGLVAWRLCDRGFDCEHCPFDAALRGRVARGEDPDPAAAVDDWALPPDRRYHRSHAWIAKAPGRRLRLGIDLFAARLLGRLTGVVLPAKRQHLRQGYAACWLQQEQDVISLHAPVTATVERVNGRVQERPGLIADEPYGAGWLVEVRGDEPLDEIANLDSAAEHAVRVRGDLDRLTRRVARLVRDDEAVGATLADGGIPVADLRTTLGRDRWRRLVGTFLD